MSWFTPNCPVEIEEKEWLEDSMRWLIEEFGADTLRDAKVVLPTDEFFPEPFSDDEDDVHAMVVRVCSYMNVNPELLELEFFTSQTESSRDLPSYEYSYDPSAHLGHYQKRRDKFVIGLETSQTRDPMCLVATIAHELAHVRLLGEGRLHAGFEDHEPLTDLLTIFMGLGVFTGNSSFSFSQWGDAASQGWQVERRGYLTEESIGYALSLFAWLRCDSGSTWSKHLTADVGTFFKQSHRYLMKTGDTSLARLC
jgi:hypothetical protein